MMSTRSTIKEGINLGVSNVPTNYVDIVLPSTDTYNAINVANTFNGTPVFYVDSTGNCSTTGSLTCSAVIQTSSNGITLPATYSSGPGTNANMLAYINASVNTVSPTFTTGTIVNVNNILLTAGVWFVIGSINFQSSAGNSAVLRLSAIISTSPTSSDSNAIQNDIPVMNFAIQTSHTSVTVWVQRIVSHTAPTTYYMNAIAMFSSGTVEMTNSKMTATRLA